MTGCLVASIMAAASSYFGSLYVTDIVIIWVYDFIGMFFLDFLKMYVLGLFGESVETLPDEEPRVPHRKSIEEHPERKTEVELEEGPSTVFVEGDHRGSIYAERLTEYALVNTIY